MDIIFIYAFFTTIPKHFINVVLLGKLEDDNNKASNSILISIVYNVIHNKRRSNGNEIIRQYLLTKLGIDYEKPIYW